MRYGASVIAIAVAISAPAAAQQAISYNMPAQELGNALRSFSVSSHQQIIFSEDLVRGKRTAALKGAFTPAEVIDRLLAGTGLVAEQTASGVIYIKGPQSPIGFSGTSAVNTTEIVVTGSRIRQALNAGSAPVTSFTAEAITERGFTQVGDMLNEITSNTPQFQVAPAAGYPVVTGGRQSPNLFNLGAGRTLTLVDGRRMVSSATGLQDRTVDTNMIPVALIDRVDVVEAGGAAVYGSDAIAGVVNYVLKRNFQGISMDVQSGLSTRGDYFQPSLRLTAGRNFASGKGNVAINLEHSQTAPLFYSDRAYSSLGYANVPNAADTGPHDGIPASRDVTDARFFAFNTNGVLYAYTGRFTSNASDLLRLNGSPLQFSADGKSVIPYNAGTIQSGSIASGGEGFSIDNRSTLYAGASRWSASALAHYDFSDAFKLSANVIYGHQQGSDPYGGGNTFKILGAIPFSSSFAVFVNRTNPFLTSQEISTLSAATGGSFAAGGSVLLSKYLDILPSRARDSDTDTYRALAAANGDFSLVGRALYYSLSYSHGATTAKMSAWQPYTAHLTNALSAVKAADGSIICRINVDPASPKYDPACVPINPFGSVPISAAAQSYISVLTGDRYKDTEDDVLATIGGSLLTLPGGEAKFSLAYEHRYESATALPFDADLRGLAFGASANESGSFHTNEYSGELLVPLVGGDFTLPLVKLLEVNGSFRHVDNSRAGRENVWGVGGRWTIGGGLTLRGTRSRNFRAPTIDQEIAPQTTSPSPIYLDPCSQTHIGSGPNRLANCTALFSQHPEYGPLAAFQDAAENQSIVLVTSGGNPALTNEVSKTTTFGGVWNPDYVRGLYLAVDVISVDLTGALSQFTPAGFLALCYDASPQPPGGPCATFTRGANGYIATAQSTYYNAGYLKFRGETYQLNYDVPLDRILRAANAGVLRFGFQATHTRKYETSINGTSSSRSEGTVSVPDWRLRFDLNYDHGPLSLFYSLSYLPPQKSGYYDTIETTPDYRVAANVVSSASIRYRIEQLTLRAGVNNIFDKAPSYPTFTYGDPIGRRFFVGAGVQW